MTDKGDLISRETLLNEFNTKCQSVCSTCEYRKWNSKLNRYECELINTAPTVNFIISPDYVNELQNINKELIKQLEEAERPHGEWIGKEEYDDYPNKMVCECSECGKMICISHNDFPNFCPNCGADMRGKADQLRDCENCVHHSDNGCEVWECEFEKRSDV